MINQTEKHMKYLYNKALIVLTIIVVITLFGCEKLDVTPDLDPDYIQETGMTTVTYLRSLSWDGDQEYDLFADLIERSGVDLNGMTLFAPADNNWENWMSANAYATVADIPVAVIEDAILNHLVDGKKKRLDLDLPDRNPQTLEGSDVPSDIENLAGNMIKVNTSYFGNTGRGLQMTVGTSSANKLIMVGDVINTDATIHLYGFENTRGSDKGLLIP